MITDIENDKVECVVTKDLSRLGRNYTESGAYMVNTALFGYKKDPNDKNHLIVYEVTVLTVRRIFELEFENKGNNRIIKVLFDERMPKQSYYKQELFEEMSLDDYAGFDWMFTSAIRVLRNTVYKGVMWLKTCTKSHFKQSSRG